MSTIARTRRIFSRAAAGCLAVALTAAGCAESPSARPASPAIASPPAYTATSQPDSQPSGEVMALVNNRPIGMNELVSLLVEDFGLAISQQLIASRLVDDEAAAKNITVDSADITRENDVVLTRVFGQAPAPEQRAQLTADLIDRMGISQTIWDMTMRRQALLRKLAGPLIQISEQELTDEFNVQYDRKVTVRDIQVASLQEAERMMNQVAAVSDPAARQEKFIELAKKSSGGVTAAQGGLLDPISAKSAQVPPAIREAAVALKKPGDLSGLVQSGTSFHVLYCVAIEEPKGVKLDDVREKLSDSIRQRKTHQAQNELLMKLIQDAKRQGRIQYVQPVLKAKSEQQDRQAAGAAAP